MFQKILSGSTPAAVAALKTPDNEFYLDDGDDCSRSMNSSLASTKKPSSHKKRSRRRRKAKNRSKVEPLFAAAASAAAAATSPSKKQHDAPMTKRDLYFALDCEMVGVGPDGLTSAVARVSIVNWENQVILDTYVQVPVPVTDYRTYVSGITPEHLQPRPGHPLMSFSQVREVVQSILRGKILIGHGLENDLKALGLYHPWCDIRDTATYSYYMREHRDPVTDCVTLVPKKLRDLAWESLNRQIQNPGSPHSPIEDAIAALDLYKESRGQWEDYLIQLARQNEETEQQQLLENQQRQQQQQLLENQQQQQQQIRRWQWLAGNGGPPPQQMYANQHTMGVPSPPPPPSVHPLAPHHPAMQQPGAYRYPPAMPSAPMIMMQQPSPAASVYLRQQQSPPPPPQQQQQQSRSSSWFGFSRRPKNNQSTRTIPPVFSQDSIATSQTMTTVQSSFSMDQSVAHSPCAPSSYMLQQTEEDVQTVFEESEEMVLESTSAANAGKMFKSDDFYPELEHTESLSCEASSSLSLPDYYEPPKYFTNPDPNPTSSSSWLKLPGWSSSSNKGFKNENVKSRESSEKERKRRSSDSEATTLALFSSMSLFPRRSSEKCMEDMGKLGQQQQVDEHSRSMH